MKDPYFDIEWIIDLMREQEPDRPDLIDQLKKSDRKKWIKQPYIRFVSGERPNQTGSEWQFDENIVLEHDTEGTIVLDILKDGRIGGIEFLSQIKYHPMTKKKTLLISFFVGTGYFIFSLIYFFGGLFDPITESATRNAIETIITLPAIIIFGVGFGNGEQAMYIAGLIVYLFILVISYFLVWLISIMNKR